MKLVKKKIYSEVFTNVGTTAKKNIHWKIKKDVFTVIQEPVRSIVYWEVFNRIIINTNRRIS